MTAIFTGLGAGAERGSGNVLGGAGLLGGGTLGRSGEQVLLNAATGNLMLQQRDEMLIGRGPDAVIARTYNSLGDLSDDNGDNWRQSTDRRIYGLTGTVSTGGSTVKRVSGDGSEITYAWNATASAYLATDGSGAYDKLTWSSGSSTWTWTNGDDQLTETYAHASGTSYFITAQTDTSGNALSFSYVSSTDKIDKVTTANGEYVQYSWSGNNITQITTGYTDLVTSTAKTLTRTRYGYDGSNRLTSVTVDLSPEDNSVADGKTYVTTYTYDGTSKRVATITQTDGSSLTIGYDGSNRIHTLTQAVASGVNRVTTIDYYTGYTLVTDPLSQVTRLDYDAAGQLTKITAPPAYSGATQQVTQFAYDEQGNLTSSTDAGGNTSSFTYDGNGNLLTSTDRLGNVVTRTYGAKNELLTETRTGSDASGASVQLTTRYVYDSKDRLRFTISPEGEVTQLLYTDSTGQPYWSVTYPDLIYDLTGLTSNQAPSDAQMTAWDGVQPGRSQRAITSYNYDTRGNLAEKGSYSATTLSGDADVSAGFAYTYYTYDHAGQLLNRVTASENTEYFVYDGLGRVVASTDLNGGTTNIVFADASNQTVVTLANGLVETSTYSRAGELIAYTATGSYSATTSNSYQYDADGRLRIKTENGLNTYYVYDKVGRLVGQIGHGSEVVEYRYDADDRVIASVRYALGANSGASLADPYNTLEMSAFRPAAHSYDIWNWTVYDKEGRVLQAIDGTGGATTNDYDGSGRLVRSTSYATKIAGGTVATFMATPPTAAVSVATSAADHVSRIFYDKDGRIVGTLDGEGYLTRTRYDAAGNKVEQTAFASATNATYRVSGSFDQLVATTPASGLDRTVHFVYDKQGNLRFSIDALNHVTEFTYVSNDAWGAVGVVRSTIRYAGSIAALSSYTLDSVRTALSNAGLAGNANNRTSWAVYDTADRLAYAIDAAGSVTGYSYDAEGHVTKQVQYYNQRTTSSLPAQSDMDSWAASYATSSDRITRNYYNAAGELTFTVDAEGYVTRFDYDGESRMVGAVRWNTAVSATDSTTLAGVAALVTGTYVATATSYDNDGRVASTTDGDGVVTTYVYNANGTLGSTYAAYGTADQVRTYFLYDAAGRVTSRYDAYGASEQTLTQYAYDGFGQVVTTTDPNGNTLTSTYDRVGQVLSQTDQEALTTSYQYNAFGDRVSVTDPRSGVGYAYYDVLGRVIATRDVANRVTETAYTVFGEVASVTQRYNVASGSTATAPSVTADTARDRVTAFTYDKLGRWLTSTDAESAVTTATYNAFGQTATRTDPFAGSTTIQTNLTYDRRGLLKTQIVDSASGGKAITTSYGYDAFGRAITLTDPNGKSSSSTYDKEGRVLTTTDALSHTTTYTYDARGNLAAVTDALGGVTRYVYDKLDRQIVMIDALGAVTANTYDADGNLVATRDYITTISLTGMALKVSAGSLTLPSTNAADHVTRYAYDKDGRMLYAVDALMHVAKYQYDGDGNVTRISRYNGTIGTDSSGLYTATWIAGAITSAGLGSANNRIDRSIYDAANQLTYSIDAFGQVTRFFYDAQGNVTKTIEYTALYTATDDPATTAMDSWATSNAASGDRTTRAYYDRKGRQRYSVDALGYVTRIDYDKAGNVTKQTAYADAYSASDSTTLANLDTNYASLPSTARVTQFNYDTAGRLIETIDPEGFSTKLVLDQVGHITSSTAAYGNAAASVTTFAYDDAGRVTSTTRGYGASEASTTAYTYDALNRVTQATAAYGTADAATTKMDYDALGRVTQQTRGYGTSEAAATQTAYDAFGRVTTATDARGSTVANVYDAIDELLSQTEQLESGTTDDQVTTFTYDNFGNAVKTVDARGNASFAYFDKLDRVIRQVDGEKFVTDTAYTRGGQVASVKRWANALTGTVVETTFPSDPTADTTHDATTTFTYDKADRLTAAQDAGGYTESYTLDGFGERTTVTNKLGGASTYTFDKNGLLLTETLPVTTKNGSGTTISVVNSYSYDARGNRTQMVEAYGAAEARTTGYAYDKLDRLTTTTHDAVTVVADDLTSSSVTPTETVKYDRRGNVIETIDAAGAHSQIWYDHLDRAIAQVVQTDLVSGNKKGTLTRIVYDAADNVTSSKTYGDLITMPSDATGSIPSPVDSTNYRETTYAYDRANRLTTTTVASLLTGEWNGSTYATTTGSVVTTLYYDKGGNVTRQQDARGNSSYAWYDKLGRKTAQVDAETYLTTWTLDAEGNALSETRFATAVGSFTPGSTPPSVSTNAADRTTTFSYDKNGRRLQEQRLSVAYSSINTSNGAATTSSAASVVTYTYNGLGEVLTKVEANGDTTTYTYDTTGRLTLETGQSFKSNAWTSGADDATPRTAYIYDGLNNLKSTRVQAAATANDTNDRITSYTYGAGGRLATMTDASGFAHTYGYDVMGRTVRDSYVRTKSDGSTTVTEAVVYRYDLAGRVTTQTNARLSGSTWVFTDAASVAYDAVRLRYDAYGELAGRGLTAGPGATAAFQEVFDYDSGGRLWHATASDGVHRFYVYDKAGNQTLALASTGADLSSLTPSTYTASLTSAGGTSTSNAATTLTVYDKNGQATATRAPDRQLTSSGTSTLTTAKTYNAFGEVTSETDARGYTTSFTYNTMGRLSSKVSPQVSVTAANGAQSNVNPTDYYGYDLSGRLVAVTDANSHVTTRLLLAGTGHGDAEAQVTKEFHADTGVAETKYDVFGDARILRNELYNGSNATTSDQVQTFDKMGRLTTLVHRGAILTDTYGYDGLGQRTTTTQSWSSGSQISTTDYDAQGRVVRSQAFGAATTGSTAGDITTTAFDWSGSLRRQTVTFAAGTSAAKTTIDTSDTFGHVATHTDMGGTATTFSYDLGGRLTERAVGSGAETQRYTYYNTGLAASFSSGTGTGGGYTEGAHAAYSYDANGRKLTELASVGGAQTENATVTYDALGRMATWAEGGSTATPVGSVAWEYDAVGNVRRRSETFRYLDASGAAASTAATASYYYAFDAMNRVVTDHGTLVSSAIVRGSGGTDLTYDLAGNRKTAITDRSLTGYANVFIPDDAGPGHNVDQPIDPGNGHYEQQVRTYAGENRESYSYDASGRLSATAIAATNYNDNGNGTISSTGVADRAMGGGTFSYDALGRQTHQVDTVEGGATVYDHAQSYDARGRVYYDSVTQLQGSDTVTTYTTYSFGDGTSGYALGAVTGVTTSGFRLAGGYSYVGAPNTSTTTTYGWYDNAVQSQVDYTPNTASPGTVQHSYYTNSASGVLKSASVVDGRSRTITLTNDALGQAIRRDEADGNGALGDPHEVWYRFDGKQVGYTGNDGTYDTSYAGSLNDRTHTIWGGSGAFRYGATGGMANAEFSDRLTPVNTWAQGAGGGSYTVRGGDSLSGIAAQLWGDAGLWYKLAEANGITGDAALTAGRTLTVPAGVMRNTDSASTFKPYDVSQAYGDTSPTTPQPQKAAKNKCGAFGMILLAVVAIAVTAIVTAGVGALATGASFSSSLSTLAGGGLAGLTGTAAGATALGTAGAIAAGVAGAVVGSAVSQLFGMATGIQQGGFSWKAVALAGLTAAVSGGIGAIGKGAGGVANALQNAAKGAAGSVAATTVNSTLGAIASGAVQAAGKAGLVGNALTGALRSAAINATTQGIATATHLQDHFDWGGVASAAVGGGLGSFNLTGNRLANSVAGRIAGVGAQSLVSGTDFGDNLKRQLPDIIGQTIGDLVTGAIGRASRPRDIAAERRAAPSEGPEAPRPNAPMVEISGDLGLDPRADILKGIDEVLAAIPDFGSGAIGLHLTDIPPTHNNIDFARSRDSIFSDAVYYPGTDRGRFQYISGEEVRDPRLRMGGNGGPPLEDWRILRQLGQPVPDGPSGALFGVLDNLLDITGPAVELQSDLLDLSARKYRGDILSIDPNHRWPDRFMPSWPENQSLQSKLANANFYRGELAATKYISQGDIGALQNETLRVYQGFVDQGYEKAFSEFKAGTLKPAPGWSQEQAIGSRMDELARNDMRAWYSLHRINPGLDVNVTVNNRLATQPEGSYRIPDIRVGGVVFDASLSAKRSGAAQIRGFYSSPIVKTVIIVRPTTMATGGAYALPRTRDR